MSYPVPAPPARRLASAEELLTLRSGVSVRVSPKHGRFFWAVTKTAGPQLLAVESGSIEAAAAGPSRGSLFAEVRAAVVRHQDSSEDLVYCDGETAAEGLRATGITASCSFPPAAAIVALDEAIRLHIGSVHARCTITTDSSRGKRSAWLGHGWVLDFGSDSRLILGQKVSEGTNILEGELRSIRYGLQAARGAYAASLQGSSDLTIRSDSQLALRMLTEPGFEPPSSNRFCREEVSRILHYTRFATVTFSWVRGHDGDPHNTAADRLAVLARRTREADLAFDEVRRLNEQVRRDVSAGIRRSSMALAA
ncbi:ribonuclease HI [Arthrobacter sp. ZGTC212]|uniref:ribonuclease HI n=1 Tax=Arthrobacter sp. ZGTC212 TaxID=2058899 RepID=UPI0015E21272|nr:RNase H family protein [Arthrobacter sp. ZGTC212]